MRMPPWLAVACLIRVGPLLGDGPPARYEVVTPRPDGIIATGLNDRGDLVGFEWADDPQHEGVVEQAPFFARRGQRPVRLPLLPTYTSTFPAAVSDAGMVVGRASKPGASRTRVPMQNQAFAWTEADGIRPLPSSPGDWASFAGGVSRDGNWVSGLTVGDDRMGPCVWERTREGGRPTWKATPLADPPGRTCSNVVAISPDGRRVAAAVDGAPYLWTRAESGRWAGEALGPIGSISPRAVNDAGAVAGIISPPDGSTHAVTWTRADGVRRVREPAGYTRSEAAAINNAGTVVGMIDGPAGSAFGPRAFALDGTHLRILDEGGPNFAAATALNDRGQVAGVFEAEEEAPPAPPARDPR